MTKEFPARNTDPRNSKIAAASKQLSRLRHTKRLQLLSAYCDHWQSRCHGHYQWCEDDKFCAPLGITDEEAGELAEMKEAHKRSSELLRDGLIRKVGDLKQNGTPARVCVPTMKGFRVWKKMNGDSTWA